ncbi:MAG: hypothetical protein NDI68_06305, partial [Arenimonas sp.]|nr:hypothetical protein [Arenimonas sp.]
MILRFHRYARPFRNDEPGDDGAAPAAPETPTPDSAPAADASAEQSSPATMLEAMFGQKPGESDE